METTEIELRSERVRHLIGKIPPLLMRLGISVITILLLVLLVAAWLIPYPKNIWVEIELTSEQGAVGYVAYSHVNQLEKDMPVKIELEGYNSKNYGYLEGYIQNIDKEVLQKGDKIFFTITIQYQSKVNIELKEYMKGKAYILLSDKSILSHIVYGISP